MDNEKKGEVSREKKSNFQAIVGDVKNKIETRSLLQVNVFKRIYEFFQIQVNQEAQPSNSSLSNKYR